MNRDQIINSAFCQILTMCDILGGKIFEANRFENGWVTVKCKHKETGLVFEVQFDIEKTNDNKGE